MIRETAEFIAESITAEMLEWLPGFYETITDELQRLYPDAETVTPQQVAAITVGFFSYDGWVEDIRRMAIEGVEEEESDE